MCNPVVSDKTHYGLKPIAVKSKAHLLTVPCVGTKLDSVDTSSTIIFRRQHNQYIDPTAAKFTMTCQFKFPTLTTSSDSFVFGRVLEDINQYKMLNAITKICTGYPVIHQNRVQFTLEGNNLLVERGGWIVYPTQGL